jgi:hypothetical protein
LLLLLFSFLYKLVRALQHELHLTLLCLPAAPPPHAVLLIKKIRVTGVLVGKLQKRREFLGEESVNLLAP